MLNLIKGEMFKFSRRKVTYIMMILYLIFIGAQFAIMVYANRNPEVSLSLFGTDNVGGVVFFQEAWAGDLMFIISAIYVAILVTTEYQTGSIRQIVSRGFSRVSLVTSKFIALVIMNVLFVAIYSIITFIMGFFLNGIGFVPEGFIEHLPFLLLGEFAAIICFVAVASLISYIMKSNGSAVALNVLFIFGGSIVVQLLAMALESEKLTMYWLPTMASNMASAELGIKDTLQYSGIFLGIAIITFLLTIFIFKKRDID